MPAVTGIDSRHAPPGRAADRDSAAGRGGEETREGCPKEGGSRKEGITMNWDVIYLVCFGTGLVLSVLSAVGGFGHLHLGHFHLGHSAGLHHGRGVSRFNAFTVLAFLCWFGG